VTLREIKIKITGTIVIEGTPEPVKLSLNLPIFLSHPMCTNMLYTTLIDLMNMTE
jgi:hypothetical protein